MSKEFFARAEFDLRQQRVRKEMAAQSLDLLVVISPVNINYLIGAAAKAYQVFQCLFFPSGAQPSTLLLRLSDVAEVTDLSLADEVRGWGGRQAEDPIDAFRRILSEKGWLKARIGLEMPGYYLSVSNYLKIKAILPEDRIVDATSLIENVKLCKSPAELAYVKKAAEIADIGIDAISEALALGSTERK